MSLFRPCIDLRHGQVTQIVGSSLSDASPGSVKTNYVSTLPPAHYALLYKSNALTGAHVIKLGPGNDEAALEALNAWHNGLQLGGGIDITNAQKWIDAGASKVIVTSWLFPESRFDRNRLRRLSELLGTNRLVVDLSCKTSNGNWVVAMNRWQTHTDLVLSEESMADLGEFASEFLVHAADVEGLCKGIDEKLVARLGEWSRIPCTYAGGAKDISDIALVDKLSNGRVDLTYGSALDIFGGSGVKFDDLVAWNAKHAPSISG